VNPDEAVLIKLKRAWKESLDTDQCDFTQTWEEAGGDSLATLHLLLRIERAFGFKITFDQMQPQMRINELAAVLMTPSMPVEDLPPVHLLPGMFGDEPRLARFRQALAGRMGFHLVAMPGVNHAAATLKDIVRTAAICARDVETRQPTGPIMLAGFSFGGCVAFETARTLIASGREVALLGLFDAPFGRTVEGTRRSLRDRMRPWALLFAVGAWGCSWDTGRRMALSIIRRFGPVAEVEAGKFVLLMLREFARHRWAPVALDVNTWLAVSAQYAPKTLSIWQRLCTRLRVVKLPGAHLDIFQAPATERLIPAFEESVQATLAQMRLRSDEVLPLRGV
jgi:thioesterase domain-containing protein/acyl carrier protein